MDYTYVIDTNLEWWCANWRFPFKKLGPLGKSWVTRQGNRFGAYRKPDRDHAGCDIMMPHLTPILAISDGIVIDIQEWFTGDRKKVPPDKFRTDALVVYHDTYIVRYGEIEPNSAVDEKGKRFKQIDLDSFTKGSRVYGENEISRVKQGQQIAKVGYVGESQMLHFEIYWGDALGGLRNVKNTDYPYVPADLKNKKYQRREDLLDPTGYLNLMVKNSGL